MSTEQRNRFLEELERSPGWKIISEYLLSRIEEALTDAMKLDPSVTTDVSWKQKVIYNVYKELLTLPKELMITERKKKGDEDGEIY